MGKPAEFYWKIPPVRQLDKTECWAACLEWWSSATDGRAAVKKAQLLVDYLRYWDTRDTLPNGDPNPDYGTVTPENFKKIMEESRWNMKVEVITGSQFNMEFVNSRTAKGPMIVCFNRVGRGGHAVVAYGATKEHVAVMDPDGGQFIGRPFSYYTSAALLVGSPK